MLEIVKGGAEPHETPQEAGARELREELGLEATRWDDLGIVYEIPSIVQEGVALFLARDVHAVASDPEDVETIVAVRMPFEEALNAAARGEITDAVTAVALMRVARRLANERP
jgi:8-oxo-dGDP phosphatase